MSTQELNDQREEQEGTRSAIIADPSSTLTALQVWVRMRTHFFLTF